MTTIGGLTLALDILIIILMIALTVTKTREHFIRRAAVRPLVPARAPSNATSSRARYPVCTAAHGGRQRILLWPRHLHLLYSQAS